MAENQFKPFAIGAGANVTPQPEWEGSPALGGGFVDGIADPTEANKAIRQPSFVAASLCEWINEKLITVPILDDGNVAEWIANFDAALGKKIGRIRVFGAITAYVSNAGNDANDGMTAATPFQHIQTAINWLNDFVDLQGTAVALISIQAGTYHESLTVGTALLGQYDLNHYQFVTTGGTVNIIGTAYTLNGGPGSQFSLNGDFNLTCVATAGGPNAVISGFSCRIALIGGNLTFGDSPGCGQISMAAGGEFTTANGMGYRVAGGANVHWYVESGGRINVNNTAVEVDTVTFSLWFAGAHNCGVINAYNLIFPGAPPGAHCTKYYASMNGVIETGGGGVNYLPGDALGASDHGGQYR